VKVFSPAFTSENNVERSLTCFDTLSMNGKNVAMIQD